jgi:hypothetical protein
MTIRDVDEAPAIGNEAAKALQQAIAEGKLTVPLWPVAARAVGINSRGTAYTAAARNQLPFRTMVVGGQRRRVVATAELARVLGLTPAPAAAQKGA